MTQDRHWRRILLLTLLFAVVWGRVWAEIPQTVSHFHAHDENHVEEMSSRGDPMSIQLHSDHHERIAPSLHEIADGGLDSEQDLHHHHLQLCSLGCSALTGQCELHLAFAKSKLFDTQSASAIIRRHERLLRPPQA